MTKIKIKEITRGVEKNGRYYPEALKVVLKLPKNKKASKKTHSFT